MSSYLVTGCSRGLGLVLVKELLKSPASSVRTILATARSSSPPAALAEAIKSSDGRLHFVQLDVVDPKSIQSATKASSEILGSAGLDVLINNAAITEHAIASAMQDFGKILETNVVAVHTVTQGFLPLLEQGREKKIANITSTLGSVGYNEYTKGMPVSAYKISKTALNMLSVQYANDLGPKGFTIVLVSPGWLRTDLGGSDADLEPEVGAKATLDVIHSSTPKDNGRFRDIFVEGKQMYSGKDAPW